MVAVAVSHSVVEACDKETRACVKLLAENEADLRRKGLRILQKRIHSSHKLIDLNQVSRGSRCIEWWTYDWWMLVWKGLHYYMWMQDKPLLQEQLSASIFALIDLIQSKFDESNREQNILNFFKAFFRTEAREFFGLDQWRVDKFKMLIRDGMKKLQVFFRSTSWRHSGRMDEIVVDLLNMSDGGSGSASMTTTLGFKKFLAQVAIEEIVEAAESEFQEENTKLVVSLFGVEDVTLVRICIDRLMEYEVTRLSEAAESDGCFDFTSLSAALFERGSKLSHNRKLRKYLYSASDKMKQCASGAILNSIQTIDDRDFRVSKNLRISEREIERCAVRLLEEQEHGGNELIETESKDVVTEKKAKKKKKRKKTKREVASLQPVEEEDVIHVVEKKRKRSEKVLQKKYVSLDPGDDDDEAVAPPVDVDSLPVFLRHSASSSAH